MPEKIDSACGSQLQAENEHADSSKIAVLSCQHSDMPERTNGKKVGPSKIRAYILTAFVIVLATILFYHT